MSEKSEKKENVGVCITEQPKLKLCIVCSVYIEHAEDVTSTRRFLHELITETFSKFGCGGACCCSTQRRFKKGGNN